MKLYSLCVAAVVCMAGPAGALDYRPVALSKFSAPPPQLRHAVVVNARGTPIGIVSKIRVDGSGAPRRIEVLCPGGEPVDLTATVLQYDFETTRIIVRDATSRLPV